MEPEAGARGAGGAGELPWVEKYRPREIADVVGNDEAVARLRVIAEEGNFPNMLLAGEPPASRVYPPRPGGGGARVRPPPPPPPPPPPALSPSRACLLRTSRRLGSSGALFSS